MKYSKIMFFITLFSFMLIVSACSDGVGEEGEIKIKVAHYFAEGHPQHKALEEEFVPYVEEKTDGKVTVEVYPNSELGAEDEYTNGVRNGSIEMVVAGMGLQEAEAKIGTLEWPYLFDDYEEAKTSLDGEVGEEIGDEFRKLDVEPIGWTANGFRAISSNDTIESMDDLKGLKLRMPEYHVYERTGEAMGVSVQPMPISEIFTALEQGVVDGQENPLATFKESGFYEVQSDVLESNHMFSPNVYLINADFMDNLDEDIQKIVRDGAKNAADYEWELMESEEDDIKSELESEGITITEPDDQFKQELEDTIKDKVYEDLLEKHDWAEEFLETVEKSKE